MVLAFDRWIGKVAIVTGASAGIGAAIATLLVEKGLEVVALARRDDRLKQLAEDLAGKKGKLYPVKTDLSKEEDILNAFKWTKDNLGPVHILINNAGIMSLTNLSDGSAETWKNIFKVNVIGLSIATREAVKDMRANNVDGHIIHINSVLGHIVLNFPGISVYTASKFSVTALAKTLRLELNSLKSKIKIKSISPGAVISELASKDITEGPFYKKMVQDKHILVGEDIANAVFYVLSTPPHVQVVALARREDRLKELAESLADKKGKLYPVKTDISKEEDILNAFKWTKDNLGPVHILINNAGIMPITKVSDGSTETWENIFKVNVIGLSIATREAVKDMRANNVDGHIIHIYSVLGHTVVNFPGLSVYSASKFSVTALAETLRLELNSLKSKIKITSISPGAVISELAPKELRETPFYKNMIEERQILDAEDIADAVFYVLSTPPHVQIQELIIRPVTESAG